MTRLQEILCCLLLLCTTGTAQATMLANGNFETGNLQPSGGWHIRYDLPGWTLNTGDIEMQNNIGYGGTGAYVELGSYSNVVMSQAVSLVHGATYNFSLSYYNREGAEGSSMAVKVGSLGSPLFAFSTTSLAQPNLQAWQTVTKDFTWGGATGSTLFILEGTGYSDSYGALVDNVSLTPVSGTPIPGALLLAGSGLAGILGLGRKRRRPRA